jgi:CheY-like chemotaxis protein
MSAQKVVIVNGSAEMLGLLDRALGAGHYDVVLVESNERAYSRIKLAQPDLVILCTDIAEPEGFRVLSMLKLDEETRKIPVLTYTTDTEDEQREEEATEPNESMLFAPQPAARMN